MSYLYHNKGVYRANGKSFFNKLEAIMEVNQHGGYIEWDYHDAIFGSAKWDQEPPVELKELYRQRALQLREAYDHLVLFYSGGVDSWNILKVFIDNNIKLDEIYIFGAFEAEEKMYSTLGFDRTPGYYTREIQQSLPLVKKLAAEKKIKVNVFDWTQHTLAAADDPDWFWSAGIRFAPDCLVRSKFHKIFREHNDLLHKGKKVGFVYGIDKPRLLRDDTHVYFAFLDVIMTTGAMPTNDILGEYWETDEYFYWTPNMPELSIKQSHEVVRWLKATNQVTLIKHINNIANFHDQAYYQEVNRAIYPEWDPNTWQIKKPTKAVWNELSRWFIEGDFEAKIKWVASLGEIERLCGTRWFNNGTIEDGLKGHISPLYKITTYNLVDH